MSFPELTAFARHLSHTSPDDQDEHILNADRATELFEFVRKRDAPELAGCLEAAAKLVQMLAGPSTSELRSEILAIACQAVASVEGSIARHAVTETKNTPKPVTAVPDATVPAAAPDNALMPPKLSRLKTPDTLHPDLGTINDMVLGKMLIALQYASREHVAGALRMHRDKGLPVGECLLVLGVSADHLLETLKLQRDIRGTTGDGSQQHNSQIAQMVREEQAALAKQYRDAPQLLSQDKPVEAGQRVTEKMFLGEVLLGAGMITNEQLSAGMNVHHHDGIMIGQALIKIGAISAEELEHGLELHRSLRAAAGLTV
jgi:hypothetical protein